MFEVTNNPLVKIENAQEGVKSCCSGKNFEGPEKGNDSAGDSAVYIYGKDLQYRWLDYAAIHLKAWFNMTKPYTAKALRLFNPLKYIDISVSKFGYAFQYIIPNNSQNQPLRSDKFPVFDRFFNFINRRDMQSCVSGINKTYEANWYAHYFNMHLLNIIISTGLYYTIGKYKGYSTFSLMMSTSAVVGAIVQGNDGIRTKDGNILENGCIKQEVFYQNQRLGAYLGGAINSVIFCYGMFKANSIITTLLKDFVPMVANHLGFKIFSKSSIFLGFVALSARFMCPLEATMHGVFDRLTFSKTRTYLDNEKYSTPASRRFRYGR